MYSNLAMSVVHLYEAIWPGPPRPPAPQAANCRSRIGPEGHAAHQPTPGQVEQNAKTTDRAIAVAAARGALVPGM
jgi:hypothetical protein